jgi:Ca-activated chloride channel family protein
LVVLGRYRDGGPATVTLTGQVNGRPETFVYQGQTFASAGGDEFLPRLWATRKIGYLLNQIRLQGENPELVSAVVDLSVRFGIVTPYTSYLITEDDILTQSGRERAADEAFEAAAAAPTVTSGAQAVEEAEAQGGLADADVAPAPQSSGSGGGDNGTGEGGEGEVVRIVGARTFVLQDDVWIETTFDPSTMTATPIEFASEEYFQLLEEHPDLADAFALGSRVIAISGGQAYEVV